MDTQSKHLTVNSTPNHFVGNDHKDIQISREEIKKNCEVLIENFKKQLDDYITSKESLSFVEFITFGTDLTKTRIKFAHIISNKLRDYLSTKNIFHHKNLDKLLMLISKIMEENDKKTKEYLIIANPGKLQCIMNSGFLELSNYHAKIQDLESQACLVTKDDDSKKTNCAKSGNNENNPFSSAMVKVTQTSLISSQNRRISTCRILPKWRSKKSPVGSEKTNSRLR